MYEYVIQPPQTKNPGYAPVYKQWWSQNFKLGGARLKDKIEGRINLR